MQQKCTGHLARAGLKVRSISGTVGMIVPVDSLARDAFRDEAPFWHYVAN